jgi:putative lipoic acid-binding regulatory protein
VKLIFGESAHFEMKWSANGKYTSITVHAMMMSVDEIFEKYEEAAKIEGIISL